MDFTADSLLSRAAHELSPRADELIRDVEQCLQREVPALWDEPDIAQMTKESVAEHVIALLFGIEHGIEPRRIDQPAADAERARRLAQRGKPVTAMLRSAPSRTAVSSTGYSQSCPGSPAMPSRSTRRHAS